MAILRNSLLSADLDAILKDPDLQSLNVVSHEVTNKSSASSLSPLCYWSMVRYELVFVVLQTIQNHTIVLNPPLDKFFLDTLFLDRKFEEL